MARAAVLSRTSSPACGAIPRRRGRAFIGNGSVPLGGGWSRTSFESPGQPKFDDPDDQADTKSISADYFKTLRVPVLKGREFTEADRDPGAARSSSSTTSPSNAFSRARARSAAVMVNGDRTVVGVVRAVRLGGPEAELRPEVFTPVSRTRAFGGTLALANARDPPRARAGRAPGRARRVAGRRRAAAADSRDDVWPSRRAAQVQHDRPGALRRAGDRDRRRRYLRRHGLRRRAADAGNRHPDGARRAPGRSCAWCCPGVVFMAVGIAIGLAAGWLLSRLVATFLFRVEPHVRQSMPAAPGARACRLPRRPGSGAPGGEGRSDARAAITLADGHHRTSGQVRVCWVLHEIHRAGPGRRRPPGAERTARGPCVALLEHF